MDLGKEINGFYGRDKTETTIFVYNNWYVTYGGTNINKTYDEIEDGVWVEDLEDVDCMNWRSPINSLDELIEAIDS